MDFVPVRSRGSQTISDFLPVFADGEIGEGNRSIVGKLVHIEQHMWLALQRCAPVQHRLILQPVVFGEKESVAVVNRNAILRIIPKLRQSPANGIASGNSFQETV